jgi:hypothetical protein
MPKTLKKRKRRPRVRESNKTPTDHPVAESAGSENDQVKVSVSSLEANIGYSSLLRQLQDAFI